MNFGKYIILRRLAVGGFGEIFLARQTGAAGFDRPVILKRLLPDLAEDEEAIASFLEEARIAATLNHPNIVAIYEVSELRGAPFIAMEYIDGETVAAILTALQKAKGRISFPVAARIIHDAAVALHHAHEARGREGRPLGLIHRDVSPQNLMVRSDGVTKVVDFGIAKLADRTQRTAAGALKGKLRYMSPEQLRGEALDHRADQFSLGVTFWEMCTGRRLFKKDLTIPERLASGRLPTVSSADPSVPRALDRVVARMLADVPSRRFESCRDVAEAIAEYTATPDGRAELDEVASLVERTVGDRLRERAEMLRSAPSEELDVLGLAPPDVPADPTVKSAPPPPRPRRVPIAAVLASAAIVAATAVFALAPRSDPPPVVLIERQADRPIDPVAAAPDGGAVERRSEPEDVLTRAFARRRADVERCIELEARGRGTLEVAFDVDVAGRVTAARILPADLEGGAFGQCLIAVARSTEFPKQRRPVSFRIPLRYGR